MSDNWITDAANRHRGEDEQRRASAQKSADRDAEQLRLRQQQLPPLWSAFGQALRRQVDAYNSAYGSQVFYVEVHPDLVSLRAERSSTVLTLRLETRDDYLGSRLLELTGESRMERGFDGPGLLVKDGQLSFHRDSEPTTPEDAADHVLKALVLRLDRLR